MNTVTDFLLYTFCIILFMWLRDLYFHGEKNLWSVCYTLNHPQVARLLSKRSPDWASQHQPCTYTNYYFDLLLIANFQLLLPFLMQFPTVIHTCPCNCTCTFTFCFQIIYNYHFYCCLSFKWHYKHSTLYLKP